MKYPQDTVQKMLRTNVQFFKRKAIMSNMTDPYKISNVVSRCCSDMHDARLQYDEKYRAYMKRD